MSLWRICTHLIVSPVTFIMFAIRISEASIPFLHIENPLAIVEVAIRTAQYSVTKLSVLKPPASVNIAIDTMKLTRAMSLPRDTIANVSIAGW